MNEKLQKVLARTILESISSLSIAGVSFNCGITLYKARLISRILRRTIADLKEIDAAITEYVNGEFAAAVEGEIHIPAEVIVGAIEKVTAELAAKNESNPAA